MLQKKDIGLIREVLKDMLKVRIRDWKAVTPATFIFFRFDGYVVTVRKEECADDVIPEGDLLSCVDQ